MDATNNEDIVKAERQIEREIADTIPYVSDLIPIEELKNSYRDDDDVYQAKIRHLEKDYQYLRRTRPDGNCFFRAFSFAYFESFIPTGDKTDQANQDELDKFIKFIKESKEHLIDLGLPAVTIEDFFEIFLGTLLSIKNNEIQTSEQLLEKFQDQAVTDYIVVYFRLITSGYLQQNSDKFANFIVDSPSIVDFCKAEVEPMYRESDHIHVVAVTSALQVKTRIIYMDRGSTADGNVNAHDFPEPDFPSKCRIHLLYRPGHYDLLYPR